MKKFAAAVAIVNLTAMSVYAATTKGAAPDLPTSNPHAMIDAAKGLPGYHSAVAADGTPFTFQGDAFTVGAGCLDLFAALQNNDVIESSALSAAVQYNAKTGQVTLVRGLSPIWGANIIWGDRHHLG